MRYGGIRFRNISSIDSAFRRCYYDNRSKVFITVSRNNGKVEEGMKIVVSVVLIGVVGFAYAYFLRKTNGNVGTGLGRNYMRDYWGIDEEDKE